MARGVQYPYRSKGNDIMINYSENKEVIDRITEINDQINEEDSKEVADNGKLTKLMFEQMLRGLYIK